MSQNFDDWTYEEITQDEANLIIEIYNCVKLLIWNKRPVTLIGIASMMKMRSAELVDYLDTIVTMTELLEEEFEIQQRGR